MEVYKALAFCFFFLYLYWSTDPSVLSGWGSVFYKRQSLSLYGQDSDLNGQPTIVGEISIFSLYLLEVGTKAN